jgi:GMP synthase (glutamine-hydrolysing)
MGDVLVLQHHPCEGPAGIGTALTRHGATLRVVRVFAGEPVPGSLGAAAALVVMGGPMGVYETDRYSHLTAELRLIEQALAHDRPVLGVCLGSQLLAAALGARVYPGVKEIGWYDIERTTGATTDPLAGEFPARFTAFVWHGDAFDLPGGATRLASSAATENHAFRFGRHAYGLLFHLEVDEPQVRAMTAAFADELTAAAIPPNRVVDGIAAHLQPLRTLGDRVFDRFADLIRS